MNQRSSKTLSPRDQKERDAFELYRLAFDDALVVPSIPNFRAAVEAYDGLLTIMRGQDNELRE